MKQHIKYDREAYMITGILANLYMYNHRVRLVTDYWLAGRIFAENVKTSNNNEN